MRLTALAPVLLTAIIAVPVTAQRPSISAPEAASGQPKAEVPPEDSSVTEHTIRLGGATVPYRAKAATMLLENNDGKPIGSLYYTAYTRSDTRDPSTRPIAFIYNGGPGAASAWLHMGAFGPRRIVVTDPESNPPAPYRLADNPGTLIDLADMVFIDPIGTGFSRVVGDGKGTDFWGVDEDARSLAQFIRRYVSRHGRWNSPKYLIGESYGTTRSAVLGNVLQRREGMDLNGIVLISAVLDFETLLFAPGHDLSYVLYLPSYAITAAYHGLIPKPADQEAFLDEVRRYALGPYAGALAQGAALPDAERAAVRRQLAAYTGLSEEYLERADLRVEAGQFRAELQRARGAVTARLDARYDGLMGDLLSASADYDPQSTAITGAYTAAINTYLRDELRYTPDRRYTLGGGLGGSWNWNRDGARGWTGATYVGTDLAQALITNPHLRVEVENGLYDLATPFFAMEYTVDHLPLPAEARARITHKYYDAGHMMYTIESGLLALKANVAAFMMGVQSPE
jgi:carboxypeptidase C (cathepsin A)